MNRSARRPALPERRHRYPQADPRMVTRNRSTSTATQPRWSSDRFIDVEGPRDDGRPAELAGALVEVFGSMASLAEGIGDEVGVGALEDRAPLLDPSVLVGLSGGRRYVRRPVSGAACA